MIRDYFGLVKFAHTIFALPFALLAFAFAWKLSPDSVTVWLFLKVLLCMVFARNTAMGFNRWADRKIDAMNPRTAGREIPKGVVSPKNALRFVAVNAALFVGTACTINLLTAVLSPAVVAVLIFYSYCKRFTSLCHLVLGLCLGIAPAGAYIAVTGTLDAAPCLLTLLVMTWCAGFDIIYALQDLGFDRENGLHSVPAALGPSKALYLSILLHIVSAASIVLFALCCPCNAWVWTGTVLFCLIVAAEHVLVTPSRQTNIGIAFGTLNGIASLVCCSLMIIGILV